MLDLALAPYRRAFVAARWLDPETWHVTLLFLGSVPVSVVPKLLTAMAGVAARWPPFDLDTVRGGGRVRGGDGTAWLWIGRNVRGVIELAEDLEWAVVRGDPRLPRPRRAPSGHVTVARRADAGLLGALREETLGTLRAGWRADRIDLVRSHLGPTGARYERVHETLLRGPTTP
jgi:2'-5' RNA ligase